jgi:hypothetical protein
MRFDNLAREPTTVLMRHAVCLLAVTVGTVITGCATSNLSPANLRVDVGTDHAVYSPGDTLSGSITFVNRTLKHIRAEFNTTGQFWYGLYDSAGGELFSFCNGCGMAFTYLDLPPLGTQTDSFDFLLTRDAHPSSQPLTPGPYRVRVWVEYHEDIFSETTIEVR